MGTQENLNKAALFCYNFLMDEVIVAKNKKFIVETVKAKHPDHTTYICTWSNRKYLLRTFVTGFDQALKDYKTLKRAGINMAKVCFHDDEKKIIVFDYFPEEDCLTALSKGPLPDIYFDALFSLYRFARFSKVALDWEPQNFMLRGSQMFYLPTKWAPLTEENPLEKEGIRTWYLGKEGRGLLARKGYDISGLPSFEDNVVNKSIVLSTVRYW